jgi:uncharacterized protein (TIGR03083 family)
VSVADSALDGYTAAIESGAARLASAVSDVLAEPVPSCPEWVGRDLVEHVGGVFAFWREQVLAADPSARHETADRTIPDGASPTEWLESVAASLVSVIEQAGADSPCWNWAGEDLDSGWVARRMALETAVHRYDAELTARDPTPVRSDLAVDGIDERLMVHLRADVPENPSATLGGSLCLACSDADAAWVVEVGQGQLHVRGGRGPASAYVRGNASDLFLFSWNRVGLGQLDLTGDKEVASAWATLPV